jgi:hypothetical protein
VKQYKQGLLQQMFDWCLIYANIWQFNF